MQFMTLKYNDLSNNIIFFLSNIEYLRISLRVAAIDY